MQGERVTVFGASGLLELQEYDPIAHAGEGPATGRLTAADARQGGGADGQVGDTVKQGQPLAVMEAMKMEHTLPRRVTASSPSCCTRWAIRSATAPNCCACRTVKPVQRIPS